MFWPRPVAAVGPVGIVGRVLDELLVTGREQQLAQLLVLVNLARTATRMTSSLTSSQSGRSGRERWRPISAARAGVFARRTSSACGVPGHFCPWK